MTDLRHTESSAPTLPTASTEPPERITAVVVGLLAAGFSVWVLLTLPIPAAVILTVAAVVAFVAWLRTTYAYPVRTRKVIAVYLGAISFQFIHMSEEYLGGFPHELTELFNSSRDWSEKSFLLTFVFGFGAIWILAAAGALYQLRIANYFLWFYALGRRVDQRHLALRLPDHQGRLLPRRLHRQRPPGDERPAHLPPHQGVQADPHRGRDRRPGKAGPHRPLTADRTSRRGADRPASCRVILLLASDRVWVHGSAAIRAAEGVRRFDARTP